MSLSSTHTAPTFFRHVPSRSDFHQTANFTPSVSSAVVGTCGGGTRHLQAAAGDFFLPSYRCPHRVERVGIMGDGGKWVCGLERIAPKKQCVIYSFGEIVCNEAMYVTAHDLDQGSMANHLLRPTS